MTKSNTVKKPNKATLIDTHLSKLPADQSQALQSLREIILSVMPQAEEAISYGVPMFKLNGKGVIAMSLPIMLVKKIVKARLKEIK